MFQHDYTYTFSSIREKASYVQVDNHWQNTKYRSQIAVKDRQFLSVGYHRVPAEIADLIDIAVAVYTADRLSKRQGEQPCRIQLVIPIRCFELFSSVYNIEQLQGVLYQYTEDHWDFTFTKRTDSGRWSELQSRMILTDEEERKIEIALWSGGLDSVAGLCTRLFTNPKTSYVLLGTGANKYIQGLQQRTAKSITSRFPNSTQLIQIPIHLSKSTDLPTNRNMRARGFVFSLLGAACAYLYKQDRLYIYENGIGAINLPFRSSEVGLDHARSVHPISLLRMGEWVSSILGMRFSFENPFLFSTKAQMCEVFLRTDTTNLIAQTESCDRRHRQKTAQCGWCSSCLLRRQALAVNQIEDQTRYVVTHGRACRPSDGTHLRAMLEQVRTLQTLLATPEPWPYLSGQYGVLMDIADFFAHHQGVPLATTQEKLIQLYRQYVQEWVNVQAVIGRSILGNNPQQYQLS